MVKKNQDKFEQFTITLPSELLREFKEYCKENGINMSGRIAKLIKEDLPKSD